MNILKWLKKYKVEIPAEEIEKLPKDLELDVPAPPPAPPIDNPQNLTDFNHNRAEFERIMKDMAAKYDAKIDEQNEVIAEAKNAMDEWKRIAVEQKAAHEKIIEEQKAKSLADAKSRADARIKELVAQKYFAPEDTETIELWKNDYESDYEAAEKRIKTIPQPIETPGGQQMNGTGAGGSNLQNILLGAGVPPEILKSVEANYH